MAEWIESGKHNLRPDDALTAIEQKGFGRERGCSPSRDHNRISEYNADFRLW